MLTGNILQAARDRIRRDMNDITDTVATGGCLSAETADMVGLQYAQKVGVIEGLARAERTILDVIEEAEQRENEDT